MRKLDVGPALGGFLSVALAGVLLAPRPLEACLHRIRITDAAGATETLTHPTFEYSDGHGNHMGDASDPYLEVITASRPQRSVWIYSLRAATVALRPARGRQGVSVTLDDGQVIAGTFPDASLVIKGAGGLGETSYPIEKLRSIAFLEFCACDDDEKPKPLDRQKAVQKWNKARSAALVWNVTDGATTIPAPGFFLRDSFSTNEDGNMIYFRRSFRRQRLYSSGDLEGMFADSDLPVERGTSSIEVDMKGLQSIEITGVVVGPQGGPAKPEARVTRIGGTPQAVALPFAEGGDFDEDDAMVWQTPVGLEGVSLKPLRKIVMIQETKSRKGSSPHH